MGPQGSRGRVRDVVGDPGRLQCRDVVRHPGALPRRGVLGERAQHLPHARGEGLGLGSNVEIAAAMVQEPTRASLDHLL